MTVNKRIKRKPQLSLSLESSEESHSINKINKLHLQDGRW